MQHYKKPVQQFADPLSKTPLYYLLSKETKKLNHLIAQGGCRTVTGRTVGKPLVAALFSPELNLVYPVYHESLPCFLIQEALPAPEFKPDTIRDMPAAVPGPPDRRRQRDEIGRLTSVLDAALKMSPEDHHNAGQNKLAFLSRHLKVEQGRILDIGTGSGAVLENGIRQGHHVWGVDTDADRAVAALDRLKTAMTYFEGTVQMCVADPRHLPFPDHSFDAVLADCSQMPADAVSACISESSRVTRKDHFLLAGFSLASRWLKSRKTRGALGKLPANVKMMLSVLSAAGLTPFWWVYGVSKAPDTFRYAQMRVLLKDAAVYAYSALFQVDQDYMLPRQLMTLLDGQQLVRQSSFDSVQIGTSRWFLFKRM